MAVQGKKAQSEERNEKKKEQIVIRVVPQVICSSSSVKMAIVESVRVGLMVKREGGMHRSLAPVENCMNVIVTIHVVKP